SYRQLMEPEQGLPRPLTPSGASALIEMEAVPVAGIGSPVLDADGQGAPQGGVQGFGLRRGTVIHTLLQRLPDIAPDQRSAMAQRYLQHAASDWSDTQRDQALRSVMAIFDDPQFASVFSPHS